MDGSILKHEKGMVTSFIVAAEIKIVLIVIMQKAGFPTYRTGRVFSLSRFDIEVFGSKLIMAFAAEILLKTGRIFAITIKIMIVVGLLLTLCKVQTRVKLVGREVFLLPAFSI